MQQYIERISKGDQEAFKVLFESFFITLVNFAQKFMIAEDAAQDFSQEALLKYWERRENFDSFHQVRSFLYLTVKNAVINELKHAKIVEFTHNHLINTIEATQPDWTEHLVKEEILRQLKNAIELLPKRSREIIRLSLLGLTNDEIALKMGITRETVRSQKKIAHKKLRQNLDDTGEDIGL